jgi:hypothetical protein
LSEQFEPKTHAFLAVELNPWFADASHHEFNFKNVSLS